MNSWIAIGILAAGYAISIFTWPRVKEWLNGVEAEIEALKTKIEYLRGKL